MEFFSRWVLKMLHKILKKLQHDSAGIYCSDFTNSLQKNELAFRESVSNIDYNNGYLSAISLHHSVGVMDQEIRRFLRRIPKNGYIIDVGGCWGWHWRDLQDMRPDVTIVILDFVKKNLWHARALLERYVGKNIILVHGDATNLIFDDNVFDGYWSVQAIQHIPNYQTAIQEAHRILKPKGVFANYSLNNQALMRGICKVLNKNYIVNGDVDGCYHLHRSSKEQINYLKSIFDNKVEVRHTEILFQPQLHLASAGKKESLLGKIDRRLSNSMGLFSSMARQESWHVIK